MAGSSTLSRYPQGNCKRGQLQLIRCNVGYGFYFMWITLLGHDLVEKMLHETCNLDLTTLQARNLLRLNIRIIGAKALINPKFSYV